MTLYLVVADDIGGENRDLFVMADNPEEAATMMLAYFAADRCDMEEVRVFPVPIPFQKGAIDWPDATNH